MLVGKSFLQFPQAAAPTASKRLPTAALTSTTYNKGAPGHLQNVQQVCMGS